jgi:DNA-directed RNA polymerase subunit RPC12/RpoP
MSERNGEVLHLHPLDRLVCENCGFEIPFAPQAGNEITCPKCGAVNDKSAFFTKMREQRLWVSQKGLKKLRAKRKFDFDCTSYYHAVINFRNSFLSIYNKQGQITLTQAIGLLIAFAVGFDQGVTELLENEYGQNLMDWLATLSVVHQVGRPPRSDKLVLMIDGFLLSLCPNGYLDLLRDALRLRSQEYREESKSPGRRAKRWEQFWKARKRVETNCKQIWKQITGAEPQAPEDWWLPIAQEQGLTEDSSSFPSG